MLLYIIELKGGKRAACIGIDHEDVIRLIQGERISLRAEEVLDLHNVVQIDLVSEATEQLIQEHMTKELGEPHEVIDLNKQRAEKTLD